MAVLSFAKLTVYGQILGVLHVLHAAQQLRSISVGTGLASWGALPQGARQSGFNGHTKKKKN